MEIEKLSIDGKTTTLKVADKILSAKINKKLVSNVLYKTNANFKGKTASLIRTSAKLGAMASQCDEKTTKAIR